ncbi:MAG: ECF transporter S component, partial [Clostridiales Family XIII bacterium]|nr:ECF transporter S component [Clostridiales Family XIII bacterium]
MRSRSNLLRVVQTALMAAIIFVVTYLIRIPMPFASGGYLNIGDTPLYIAAYLLGG